MLTVYLDFRYSGVIRGSGAYVPPSARKPSDAPPTSKPAQTSTEPPEKEAVTPAMAVNGKPAEVSIADAAASSKAPPQNVTSAFQSFVKDEKKRLEPKKAAAATKAREDKLAEFKSFSQNFKVHAHLHRATTSAYLSRRAGWLSYASRLGQYASCERAAAEATICHIFCRGVSHSERNKDCTSLRQSIPWPGPSLQASEEQSRP